MDQLHNIQLLNSDRHDEAIAFVCSEFVRDSVLHQALDVPLEAYIHYMRDSVISLIEEGLSFIAVNASDNSISGCLVAGTFTLTQPHNCQTPEYVKPIKSLLVALEKQYLLSKNTLPAKTLLVDMAVVSPTSRGHGVYTALREAAHQRGRELDFLRVIGELSSSATQHVCVEKMGHKVICEIPYRTFEYNGTYPFESIQQPVSIQLVEGVLN